MSRHRKTSMIPIALTLSLLLPAPIVASAQSTTLIPRQAIFGNPERAGAQVSPDGKFVSFLAPYEGVMNVWVVERGKPLTAAKPMTSEKVRPIRAYSWMANGEDIVYAQDKGGDENFLLYAVNVKTSKERTLTDFKGVRVQKYGSSLKRPDELVVGINDRDKRFHDPYLLNVKTGALKKLFENTAQYSGFMVDDALDVRFATKSTPDGGWEMFRLEGGRATAFDKVGFEDSQTTSPEGLTRDGKTLYWRESRGRNTPAFMAINLDTGAKRTIGEDPRADFGGSIVDPATGRVLAYTVNYLKNEWRAVDDTVKGDIDFLDGQLKGEWGVQSQTRNGRIWVIGHDPVTAPARTLVFDRDAKSLTELYVARPALIGAPLPTICPLEIRSRDGMTLVSYLALPAGSDKDGDCRPDTPMPLVLNVHGGPWARDGFGYDAQSTWLTNRGYASLQVNFRSSTGFGKSFINAGDREWGRKMHDDLIDGIDWAVTNKVALPDKIAIYGGSYGGYAALWGATNTPDRFACAVAVVAPSNLETLLATVPPYWESFREQLYRRVGDPRTEVGKALLTERSPLTHVDRISRPLLIGQGANDPRVKQAEADQIVTAMQKKNIPVTYVLFPDEGHGFARPANRTSFYAVTEAFLSRCLGGRFEPPGKDFDGASITVPTGMEHVPGLKEVLARK